MASHIEMQRIAADPVAVRSLADYLLLLHDAGWTEWETDFLHNMSKHKGPEPISMRQREVLLQLRDDAKLYSKFDSFSIAVLIKNCWQARYDLSEGNEEFIARLREAGATALKRRALMRLLSCSRDLGLIDRFVAVD
jgi:hypothetical protein